MDQQQTKYNTIYEDDHEYQLAELDANLKLSPKHFGSRQIGLALVGVGRMGSIHLANLMGEPRAKLLYLIDGDEEKINYLKKKYFLNERQVKCLNLNEWPVILNDKSVEALIISTPTSSHEKYVSDGLNYNKHILCEKPLANELKTINSLLQLAEDKQLILIVAFNRRFDLTFRKIKQQLKRGDIGKLRVLKICSRNSPPPSLSYIATSGGMFHDTCIHDFDIILWLTEELPNEVYSYAHAHSEDYKKLNDFDTIVVTMKFPSGLICCLDTSRFSACGYEQRMELFGPKGVLRVNDWPSLNYEKYTDIGLTKTNQCHSFVSRYKEAYATELVELFNHIEGNETLELNSSGNKNYLPALMKIIDAAKESALKGQPIKLNWSQDEECF